MEIWGVPILASIESVISVLKMDLVSKQIELLRDVKPTHGNIMLTCIKHGGGVEKKPALGISTRVVKRNGKVFPEGTCHCYVCGYTTDLPNFISDCFGHNDGGNYGFKWLTSNFVNLAISERTSIELDMSRGSKKCSEPLQIVSEEELESYRYYHPYMTERKLTERVIEYFDVGFDQATNCLTFPVKDLQNRVLFIQRRAVEGKFFMNAEASLRGSTVYGLYQVYQNLSWIKRLFVTESIIDALTWWGRGEAGIATLGSIPTEAQLKLLKAVPVRKFVSSYDNDKAGEEGARRLRKSLEGDKVLYNLQFPKGVKDVNQLDDEQFSSLSMSLF